MAKFDCAKDTDNAQFTVYQNVEKKALNENSNSFFSPEVISAKMGIGVDWQKADIYSLAKTSLYILTGRVVDSIDDIENADDVGDDILLTLMEMMDVNPDKRPKLRDLIEIIE